MIVASAATTLAQFVTRYGYFAVVAAVLAENLGLPVPGETAVFVAAGSAAAGHLNIFIVWFVAVTAAIAGDNLGFGLGHYGGKPLFIRFGTRLGVSAQDYAMTEQFFDRFGGPAVAVARFIPVIRVIAAITAGTSGMEWDRFLPWQALGACLWATYAVTLGYFGDKALNLAKPVLIEEFGRWWPLVAIAVAVVAVATVSVVSHLLARRLARQDRKSAK